MWATRHAYTSNLTTQGTWELKWGFDRLGNLNQQNWTAGVINQPDAVYSAPVSTHTVSAAR